MKYLEKFLKFVMVVSSAVLAIVTFLQVIMRFLFKMPVAWGQDIIRLSFVYLVFLGAAYCLKTNDHLNIDIIFSLIPNKAGKILQTLINIILLGFFVFLLIYGVEFSKTGITQKAPYTAIPMIYYYASIPISAAFLILYDIEIIINQIKNIKDGDNK